METLDMNYSGKNIPLPTKCLLEKIELVIKRMHWKAHFFLKKNDTEEENDSASEPENDHAYYGLKSKRTPPKINEMANFEKDMLNIVVQSRIQASEKRISIKTRQRRERH